MKYIFTAESNALVVTVNEESGKFKTEKKTFKAPSFELANESIDLKDYGTFEKEYKFAEIQTIDGVAPTDTLDALSKLMTLTANFNGGGTAPTTETQRTTATSGTVPMISGKADLVLIHEAGATTALIVELPTSPVNNQRASIMSVGGIVGLTITTAVGTIIGAVTTLAVLATTELIWKSSENKWYKIR